jgi:hypothetical protein
VLTTTVTRCYSTRKGRKSSSSQLQKVEAETTMDHEKDGAFYVVRKGDVVGIYTSLSDSQAQVGSSVIFLSILFLFFIFFILSFLFLLLVAKLMVCRKVFG